MNEKNSPEYRADYNKGWRYSGSESASLDHADRIRASDAWIDGYMDYAAGRPKWHLRDCLDHGRCGTG